MATDTKSKLPVVEVNDDKNEIPFVQVDDAQYSGKYRKLSDGHLYALAIQPNCPYEKTHKAKNNRFFWEGTEAQFNDQFRKE